MSSEPPYCERVVKLEEAVAMFRVSNGEMSEMLVQMQREMDKFRGQINKMETTTADTAVPGIPMTSIDATTAPTACGSVNILSNHIGTTTEKDFQQKRLTALEEAFGVLNAKLLEKIAQMQRTVDEQRTSINEMGTTNMKQRVSNMELTRQKRNVDMLNAERRHMAAEYRSKSPKDVCIVSSSTASSFPAIATTLPTTISNSIDPFMSDATTASSTVSDEKISPSFSNITVAATATTSVFHATTIGPTPLPSLPTISTGCREVLSKDLYNAAGKGNAERIRQLMAEGATFSYRDQYSLTALHRAAGKGHVNAVRSLIELGAPLEAEDNDKGRPLHYAALYEWEDCVELLLLEGANVNARDKNGSTPLHYAAVEQSRSIVEMLIAAGADRGARDNFGKVPKDYTMNNTLRALL